MKASIAIAALASLLASVSLAAPAAQIPRGAPPSRADINGTTIYPFATSTYAVWTGAITYGTSNGLVQKTQTSSDISTLVTFEYPSWTAGKQCTFGFSLSSSATVTGTGQADVFSSLENPTGSTTGWPPGNMRNNDLFRFQAVVGGQATLVVQYGGAAGPFSCPSGQTLTYEIVPTGDLDEIQWNVDIEGPEIDVT
jgi:hypothetical protein